MRSRAFGRGGAAVPVIGQGSWNLERAERARALETVRAGLDAGLTHVDTAEMYGSGRVEEVLGEALAGRRDEVFLVSKVLPSHASADGVVEACERSLARLRTDRLECYLLHWESSFPFEETLAGFERLHAAGKIRSFGVSNFDEERLEEAVRLAGPGRIACNQVLYHLRSRGAEHAVVPACQRLGVAFVGYSPFGQADFPAPGSSGGRLLAEVAEARGATPRQVALAFLVREEGTLTIPMTSRAEHARENAAAGALELDAGEVARIDAAFPRGPRRPGVETL